MEAFTQLKKICETLLGPNGCPWDKKQTFQSLRPYLLEEMHELLEAVDRNDRENMVEELGDIFFQLILFSKIGEIDQNFTLEQILEEAAQKLIRRHPHVFGKAVIENEKELFDQWEAIKKQEKKKRRHPFEGIPKSLGALARAQKVIDKLIRAELHLPPNAEERGLEEEIGDQFIELIVKAHQKNIDAESAVRQALKKFEEAYPLDQKKS